MNHCCALHIFFSKTLYKFVNHIFSISSLAFTRISIKTIKIAFENIGISIVLLYLKLGLIERKRMIDENFTNTDFCEGLHVGMQDSLWGQSPRSNKQRTNCCEKKLVGVWCALLRKNVKSLLQPDIRNKNTQENWIRPSKVLKYILSFGLLLWILTELQGANVVSNQFTRLMFLSILICSTQEFTELQKSILKRLG